jgi:hypothetical protein
MRRVLITGSRIWESEFTIRQTMQWVERQFPGERLTLVSGGAAGADRMGQKIARELGWGIEVHLAKWHKHDAKCPNWHLGQKVCRRAGIRRNEEMVHSNPDLTIAFIANESMGATHCADYSKARGIPTYVSTATVVV